MREEKISYDDLDSGIAVKGIKSEFFLDLLKI